MRISRRGVVRREGEMSMLTMMGLGGVRELVRVGGDGVGGCLRWIGGGLRMLRVEGGGGDEEEVEGDVGRVVRGVVGAGFGGGLEVVELVGVGLRDAERLMGCLGGGLRVLKLEGFYGGTTPGGTLKMEAIVGLRKVDLLLCYGVDGLLRCLWEAKELRFLGLCNCRFEDEEVVRGLLRVSRVRWFDYRLFGEWGGSWVVEKTLAQGGLPLLERLDYGVSPGECIEAIVGMLSGLSGQLRVINLILHKIDEECIRAIESVDYRKDCELSLRFETDECLDDDEDDYDEQDHGDDVGVGDVQNNGNHDPSTSVRPILGLQCLTHLHIGPMDDELDHIQDLKSLSQLRSISFFFSRIDVAAVVELARSATSLTNLTIKDCRHAENSAFIFSHDWELTIKMEDIRKGRIVGPWGERHKYDGMMSGHASV